jgi:hypothetical protein
MTWWFAGLDREIRIIALEIMPVSSRITHPAIKEDAMVCEIQAIAKYHSWSRLVLGSHSYGSIISTHLLKSPLTTYLIGLLYLSILSPSFSTSLTSPITYSTSAGARKRISVVVLWE